MHVLSNVMKDKGIECIYKVGTKTGFSVNFREENE